MSEDNASDDNDYDNDNDNDNDNDGVEYSFRDDAIEYAQTVQKRGVIYISRIPPFMKPNKVRNCFEAYGEVTRLYLAEEDSTKRKRRKLRGGNGSKQFTEGWVEFADKAIAKNVAASLNLQPIGTKKGDYYHDDLWNLKYLRGFKWEYLTEKIAYERRVRESKIKAAMLQAKRVNAEFAEMVEKSKVEKHVEERKRKRGEDQQRTSGESSSAQGKKKREFRQHQPISVTHGSSSSKMKSESLKEVFANSK